MIVFIGVLILVGIPLYYIIRNTQLNKTSQLYPFMAIVLTIFYLVFNYALTDFAPFAPGGDDIGYYYSSLVEFNSLSDWFNPAYFLDTYAQAGYSMILAWINQFFGESIYIRKVFNFSFFLLISLYWYKIAFTVYGKKLAPLVAVFILFSTPLLYYSFIILKDMTIVLIQSIIIYNIILLNGEKRKKSFIYIILLFMLLIMISLRLPLAVFNVVLILISTYFIHKRNSFSKFSNIVVSASLFASIIFIGFSAETLKQVGVSGDHRNLDTYLSENQADRLQEQRGAQSKVKYSLLFFIKEVSGFRYNTWEELQYESTIYGSLRGIAAIPWILFFVPLFFFGIYYLLKSSKSEPG